MKRGLLIFAFIIIFVDLVSSLGISHYYTSSDRIIEFKPGLQRSYSYTINGDRPDQEIEVYVMGDLAQYAKLNTDRLIGGGGITVNISLPQEIDVPGPHILYIGAIEVILEGVGIGTRVAIQTSIIINVPYPGRYVEATLKADDVNEGEPVNIELQIWNKGKEDYSVNVLLEMHLGLKENILETISLGEKFMESGTNAVFQKELFNYKPGNYFIEAVISYGGILKLNDTFRVGTLRVDLINYTYDAYIKSTNKFDLIIESKWNNKIENVFADIRIFNGTATVSEFKTPSEILEPWGTKMLRGYFDTIEFGEGDYKGNITINYEGKESRYDNISLKFSKKPSLIKNVFFIGTVISGIIAIVFILIILRMKLKNKKREKIKNNNILKT
ncbi:hypothetical protein HYV49_00155 [Candidatus Pacearchaeota archaeon]|nr:hypothetical protein [Candidatus Pacearchaeota archaeon]